MFKSRFLLPFSLACLLSAPAAAIDLVASIRPLELIAEPLLLDGDTIHTLVDNGASPHSYALKVSDMRRLESADAVLWIGPELELFLQKPLSKLGEERELRLSQLPNLSWPEESEGEDHHGHDHGDLDPHLWLNPANVAKVATFISNRLQQLDADKSQEYELRLTAFLDRLSEADASASSLLEPLSGRGFAVYHRAYDHFIDHYQLKQLAFITLTPEQKSGARHLYQLQQQLADNAVCVFGEIYGGDKQAKRLAEDAGLKFVQLDPLGSQVDSYVDLLLAMAADFERCLAP